MLAERHCHHHEPEYETDRRTGNQDLRARPGDRLRHEKLAIAVFRQEERVDTEHECVVIDRDERNHERGQWADRDQESNHDEFRQGREDLRARAGDVVIPVEPGGESLARRHERGTRNLQDEQPDDQRRRGAHPQRHADPVGFEQGQGRPYREPDGETRGPRRVDGARDRRGITEVGDRQAIRIDASVAQRLIGELGCIR